MKLRRLISLSLLLLAGPAARAQFLPADDFFHRGAQSYITNNVAQAREAVDQGLKFYPDDAKLKKLDELLKQQNQQQQSQQNQPKDQEKKPDKKDQSKPDQPKDKPEQKKSEPQKADAKEPKPDEKGKEGQMTPQEAKQLLDAQKNDEQMMPVNRKDKPPDQQKAIKDW